MNKQTGPVLATRFLSPEIAVDPNLNIPNVWEQRVGQEPQTLKEVLARRMSGVGDYPYILSPEQACNAVYPLTRLPLLAWDKRTVPNQDHVGGRSRFYIEKRPAPGIERGYLTPLQATAYGNYPVLIERNGKQGEEETIWMSPSVIERESLAFQLHAARGHVLVVGLGLGLLVRSMMHKKNIRSVTVAELDKDLCQFIDEAYLKGYANVVAADIVVAADMPFGPDGSFKGKNGAGHLIKTQAVRKACIEFKKAYPEDTFDAVLIDIWDTLGSDYLINDTTEILKAVNSKGCYDDRHTVVHSWGQELEYVSWLAKNKMNPETHEDKLDCLRTWADFFRIEPYGNRLKTLLVPVYGTGVGETLPVPVYGTGVGVTGDLMEPWMYHAFCLSAAVNTALR